MRLEVHNCPSIQQCSQSRQYNYGIYTGARAAAIRSMQSRASSFFPPRSKWSPCIRGKRWWPLRSISTVGVISRHLPSHELDERRAPYIVSASIPSTFFYSNFPLWPLPNYYFPPSPAQHTLRWQYDDIIGIDLFLLLQVYC